MKSISIILLLIVLWSSCKEQNVTAEGSIATEDSLKEIIEQKNLLIDDYLTAFIAISKNLDSINKNQKNIVLKTNRDKDLKPFIVNEINSEIAAIRSLMEQNSRKITFLNEKLKTSEEHNRDLKTAISILDKQFTDKVDELYDLKVKLRNYNLEVNQLEDLFAYLLIRDVVHQEIINAKNATLHKAFYISGSNSELQKYNIIDKKGGFLGIGRVSQLKKDFNEGKFTAIDYYETYKIPLNCKKARIVTNHPSASFTLTETTDSVKTITITDPDEFWKASKYLVVIKN